MLTQEAGDRPEASAAISLFDDEQHIVGITQRPAQCGDLRAMHGDRQFDVKFVEFGEVPNAAIFRFKFQVTVCCVIGDGMVGNVTAVIAFLDRSCDYFRFVHFTPRFFHITSTRLCAAW